MRINICNIINTGGTNDSSREAWIVQTLKKIPNGSKILDAGAGQKRFKKNCGHLKYISQDFGKYNGVGLHTGAWDQDNLDIVSDITEIPVEKESFDAIMCIEVFEHLPNPIKAIEEFSRIIKPGGNLIITAPFSCGTHFSPYFFYTGFSKYFYETHLLKNDFKIIEIKANGNFFEYLSQELRRLPITSKKYTNSKFPIFYKILIIPILIVLSALSKKDKKSDEFMCFGYNVFAIKK